MLDNTETLQFCISAFGYGYILYSWFSFHSIYYLELHSLQSSVAELPKSVFSPWMGWIVGSVLLGTAVFPDLSRRIPYQRIQVMISSSDGLIVQAVLLVIVAVLLRRMPSFPEVSELLWSLTPVYFLLSISFSIFIVSHMHCRHS
jgi:hypothetical protein